ncbi:MAG: hypothetical protein H6728_04645 [Myxococcales bacterium]|nr:hypothetical protein [Myxococcales bacterium]MCB9642342.1 hypothetical protein [Myxococcales bacterium]
MDAMQRTTKKKSAPTVAFSVLLWSLFVCITMMPYHRAFAQETPLPTPNPTTLTPPAERSPSSKPQKPVPKWGGNELSVGGLVGTWGSSPQFGLRGVLPLSRFLAFRVGWTLMFHLKGEESYNLSAFTLDLVVRLPSPYKALRYYAVTRLDFWPLWNLFNTSPSVSKISTQPVFGLSVLAGLEGFLLPRVSWFLETGFSSGMVIGFAPIHRPYEAFGFLIQSGFQTYF